MALVTFIVSLTPFVILVGFLMRTAERRSPPATSGESLEPGETWGRHQGTRVYRKPEPRTDAARRGFFRSGFFVLIFVVLMLAAVAKAAIFQPAASFDWGGILTFGVAMVAMVLFGAWWSGRECREIRLSDDGTCELETPRGARRLHVNQIRSVRYQRGEDGATYSIRFDGGKAWVSDDVSDFHDFLTRLKSFNPAVDLSSFPRREWPGLAASAEARKSALRRIRSAVFPVFVVILLAWLFVETLR